MTKKMPYRCYSDLCKFKTFEDRFNYLRVGGIVGEPTFGFERYLNQAIYTSSEWRKVRDKVIIRDEGCDLGVSGYDIYSGIIIHHMIPITVEDIINRDPKIFDPEFLISTSKRTHNAIHFGDDRLLPKGLIERYRNDTCPWR